MSETLSVQGFCVGYGRRPVIQGLDLAPLPRGSLTALVGPNAAGKSTLLRGLAGLLRTRGSVTLGGTELLGLGLERRARHMAYMPQSLPQGVALTVVETLIGALRASPTAVAGPSGRDATTHALRLLERIGIADLALLRLDRLSGGQRQMVGLAQALVRQPEVLLLDEPTSALDLRFQLAVMGLVRELTREAGLITLVVLHDLGLAARFADRLVVLSEGAVAAEGTPDRVLTPALLARVYGLAARVERCSQGQIQVLADAPIANAHGP
jgi:iron complex transport system ATP-binding protein